MRFGQRGGQLGRARRVDRRVPHLRGRGRVESGGHGRATILTNAIVVGRQLELLADLPDEARLGAVDVLWIDAWRGARRWRTVRQRRPGALEGIGRQRIEIERSGRHEEPEFVLLDRSPERSLEVGQLVDAVGRLQTAGLQLVRQVVRPEAVVLIACKKAAVQRVAAVFRNHIEPHATARDVRRGAAGRIDHLLAHRAVEVVLHGAVAVQTVDHQPVDQHRRLRRAHAVRRHVGLLHRARSAHVGNV